MCAILNISGLSFLEQLKVLISCEKCSWTESIDSIQSSPLEIIDPSLCGSALLLICCTVYCNDQLTSPCCRMTKTNHLSTDNNTNLVHDVRPNCRFIGVLEGKAHKADDVHWHTRHKWVSGRCSISLALDDAPTGHILPPVSVSLLTSHNNQIVRLPWGLLFDPVWEVRDKKLSCQTKTGLPSPFPPTSSLSRRGRCGGPGQTSPRPSFPCARTYLPLRWCSAQRDENQLAVDEHRGGGTARIRQSVLKAKITEAKFSF